MNAAGSQWNARSDRLRRSRRRCGVVRGTTLGLLVLLLESVLRPGVLAQGAQPSLEILGPAALGEDIRRQWSVVLRDAPTARSGTAYEPSVQGVLLDYEPAVEYRWNFGDGSGVVSTGPRVSASHTYADDGTFDLTVDATIDGRVIATARKAVEVRNRNPVDLLIAAVEVDPTRSLFELSAAAVDAAGDDLTYAWDLGRGAKAEGVRVEHAFPAAGRYPVTLTVTDDDGGRAQRVQEIVVGGTAASGDVRVDSIGSGPVVADVVTSFSATVSGSLRTTLTGRVRPVAGIHLAPVEGARSCRFMFTAADPVHLAMAIVILDLPTLPAEGARYRVPLRGSVNFYPDRARYERSLRVAGQRITAGDILDRMDRLIGNDTAASGAGGGSSGDPRDPTPSASSPLGLDDHVGFRPTAGVAEFVFVPRDRADGTFKVELVNPNRNRADYPAISLEGRFAIDLEEAVRDGLMRYDRCGGGALEIDTRIPAAGEEHVSSGRLGATFTHDVDPATLNADTVQLTYPAAVTRAPVVVESRILRRDRAVILQPVAELFSGVRYSMRVRTGPKGVRAKNGVALDDRDGTGWTTWSFTTSVELETGPGGRNLSCHVYQTVRDAPLIVGKPAVARIYADWKRHPEVHESAQVEEFLARVSLDSGPSELASDLFRFVRPDRWSRRGIELRDAAHTANLFWTPDENLPSSLQVSLEVPGKPDESPAKRYFSRCSTPRWPHQPALRVDFYMVAVNGWRDGQALDAARPRILNIIGAAGIFMKQVFPFRDVDARFVGLIPSGQSDCDNLCAGNLLAARSEGKTDADVIVGFIPSTPTIPPVGSAFQRLNETPRAQGVAIVAVDDDPNHDDRFVHFVTHEVGHTLQLEHMPSVDGDSRTALLNLRNAALAADGSPVHQYQGIEGFRIVPAGRDGWNKSSTEGNQEGAWLTPLMYPGSIPYRDTFIMRHHYLQIQRFLEGGGGDPRAGVPPR